MIADLKLNGVSLDVILLCETWLNVNNDSLISIDGYTCLTKHRTNGKTGGGLAIYVKTEYNPMVMDLSKSSIDGICESLFVGATVNKREYVFGEIYRIPNTNTDKFNTFLQEILPKLKNKKVILGSDQNLDLLKASAHAPTNRFLNAILDNNLIPTILRPTRVTH